MTMVAITLGTVRGIITGVLLVLFIWLVAWAWSRRRAPTFEAAARAPLEEDKQKGTTS
jgi:cytochrome c oxidase cbb3-type subunit 4